MKKSISEAFKKLGSFLYEHSVAVYASIIVALFGAGIGYAVTESNKTTSKFEAQVSAAEKKIDFAKKLNSVNDNSQSRNEISQMLKYSSDLVSIAKKQYHSSFSFDEQAKPILILKVAEGIGKDAQIKAEAAINSQMRSPKHSCLDSMANTKAAIRMMHQNGSRQSVNSKALGSPNNQNMRRAGIL